MWKTLYPLVPDLPANRTNDPGFSLQVLWGNHAWTGDLHDLRNCTAILYCFEILFHL